MALELTPIITHITLDLATTNNFDFVKAVQGDNETRYLYVTLLSDNVPYELNCESIVLRGTKPDGTGVFNYCSISENGEIIVELTKQILAIAGIGKYEIALYGQAEVNAEVDALTTFPFRIVVDKANIDTEIITSTNEFNAITEIMGNAETLKKSLDTIEEAKESALQSREEAALSAKEAAASEDKASISETNAKASETASKMSETNAAASADDALNSAESADASATNAAVSAGTAGAKATEASSYASQSESYAVGGTGTRTGENSDNAKYYYEQAKDISSGLAGAIMPMGTVTFANLPALSSTEGGWMYNISDQFTTTSSFKEGAGNVIPAGANVYKTADGYWDILAGTPVTGVKGNSETAYRKGNINLTPANLGITVVNNTADADKSVKYAASAGSASSATKAKQDANGNIIVDTYQTKTGNTADNTVSFTSGDSAYPTWTTVPLLSSGEKHSSIMNKISTMFKNVRYLSNLLGKTDISAIGGGTVTGAISTINAKFANYLPISVYGALYTCNISGLWSTVTVGSTNFITFITGCCNFLSNKKCDIHIDIMLRDNFGSTSSPHNTMMVNMDTLKKALSMSSLTFVTNQTEARLILPWNWTPTYGINDSAIAFSCYANDFGGFRFTNDGRITRFYYDSEDGQIKWGNLLLNTNNLDCRKEAIWRVDIYGAEYT